MREDWIEIEYKNVVNKISTNKKKLKQKEYLQKGKYPVIDQGQELIGGFTDDEIRLLDCKLPAIVFGDHTKIVKLINFKFAPGADGTKILEPKTFVLPKYLNFLTQILVLKIKDKGYARHYQHIEKQQFPLAPLPEQRAIVAKIEKLFSDIDSGVANLKAAKDKLEIYRQAVLKKAFEGELTKNTINFKKSTLGNEFKIIMGQSPKSEFYNKDGIGLPFFQGKREFTDFYAKVDTWSSNYTKVVNKNSVLLSIRAPIGAVNLAPQKCAIGRGLAGFEAGNIVESKFIFYLLTSIEQELNKKGTGTTFKAITKDNLFNTSIKIPTIKKEFSKIVTEIETRLSVCDNILATIEEALKKSEALRQSILKKAFEGKLLNESELKACRKEADWEPADKLLERIKKEKKAGHGKYN